MIEIKAQNIRLQFTELTPETLQEAILAWKKENPDYFRLPTHLLIGESAFRSLEKSTHESIHYPAGYLIDSIQIRDCKLTILKIDSYERDQLMRCEILRLKT